MKKLPALYLILLPFLLSMIVSGCGAADDRLIPTQTAQTAASISAVTPTSRSTPTGESDNSIKVSDQAYISPSEIFQINLPAGWNCSETGSFQVNCESPASDAVLQARITSTGYELTDESLSAFAQAELVHRYGFVKEYLELDQEKPAGRVVSRATWRENDDYWESVDDFIREGRGVFHLTFASKQAQSESYAGLYNAISESVEMYPERITPEAFYPFKRTVSSREALFEIEVPTSWGRYIDTAAVEKTVVEGYVSPDKRASVQIAIYQQGTFLRQDAKANNTREIMFALYGYDLKNSDDRVLPDGRERLTWYATGKDISGITDFDTYVNTLYLFTIVWEPSSEIFYLPILTDIQESFTRK